MNQPTPAIVAQDAVRRLPRLALLLLCLAYVVPGFVGRDPWKSADITAFGYMAEIARGASSWLQPQLLGQAPEFDALLPYWLGAWAMRMSPSWISLDFAARVPFVLLLALTLLATWYSVYNLARSPKAQPVAFAFGGEANPTDYARAIADGGLLALIACLGLAQLSHETTPSLAQVGFTSLAFYAMAALPYRLGAPVVSLFAGLVGLALSGAPSMAALFGIGGILATLLDRTVQGSGHGRTSRLALIAAGMLVSAAFATALDLWRWRNVEMLFIAEWRTMGRLLLWFTWPAWPLAAWTLLRWRRQLTSHHVALPLWFVGVSVATTLLTPSSDRSLLLGLPAMAALAAFALPTLSRSVAALIDWFTLLFFSGWAVVIWVVWISLQTGIPAKPAANVARLLPGVEPGFSGWAFGTALAATIAWGWLVYWRTGRHRSVIWKSLVLPASGAALCWLLLTTLMLSVLNYARSYVPVVYKTVQLMQPAGCVEVHGLNRAQLAALRYHGNLELRPAGLTPSCPWLIADDDALQSLAITTDMRLWALRASIRRPADANDNVLLYHRMAPQ